MDGVGIFFLILGVVVALGITAAAAYSSDEAYGRMEERMKAYAAGVGRWEEDRDGDLVFGYGVPEDEWNEEGEE